MVGRLRVLLSTLEMNVLRHTEEITDLHRQWQSAEHDIMNFLKKNLTSRRLLGNMNTLLERLSERPILADTAAQIDRQLYRARRLRERLATVAAALQTMLDLERREEREREDRTRRKLALALAAVAAVAALPIVMGQMNWSEMLTELAVWPGITGWIKPLHPYLTLGGAISAVLIIVLITGLLGASAVQRRFVSGFLPRSDDARMSEKISEVSRLVGLASDAWDRRRIEELDSQACELVADIFTWLESTPKSDLSQEVSFFEVATQFLDNRPTPFQLPRALCMYRYRTASLFGRSVVSNVEYERVLGGYGVTEDEREHIDKSANESRQLPPRQFLNKLQDLKISALRDEK
jgi:hypothetical protein